MTKVVPPGKLGLPVIGETIAFFSDREFARLEIKLFAARLLRGYGWELLPDQDLEMVVIPTPKPRDGLKVKFWKL